MHVRLSRIVAGPLLLDDAVRYIDEEGRLPAGSQAGNLGISLEANPELGSRSSPGLISPVSTPSPTRHSCSGTRSATGSPGPSPAKNGSTGMTH
jgi:hypothetical protein